MADRNPVTNVQLWKTAGMRESDKLAANLALPEFCPGAGL
jgi:hypothetical protein